LELDDLVIVERKDDGNVKLHQPSRAGFGAASGALWGGLIGLIFSVPLFGMAIGPRRAPQAARLSDTGVNDDFLKRLGEELAPGNAAVIVLVRQVSADKVLPQIQVPGTVIQTSLSNGDEQRLQGHRRDGIGDVVDGQEVVGELEVGHPRGAAYAAGDGDGRPVLVAPRRGRALREA
jgi:uncharacterized membrane protein